MVKTAIENNQNLIVEGCYIPFDWTDSFEESYRAAIRAFWLIMTENYIEANFDDIVSHANDVEQRLDDSGLSKQWLMEENEKNMSRCILHDCSYILIEDDYDVTEAAGRLLNAEGPKCV